MSFAAEGALGGAARTEILFIDSGVQGYQALIEGARPGLEVVLLSADLDGIAQIAAALAGRSGVDAVHVISHGAPGSLALGSGSIGLDDLDAHSSELATIRQALSKGADMLLYGCDVAAGDAGQAFVARLAGLTGADVAASEDLTGAASKGGDWHLEIATGTIEAASALSQEMQQTYAYTLAPNDQNFDSQTRRMLDEGGETIGGVTYTLMGAGGVSLIDEPGFFIITPDPSDLAVIFNYGEFTEVLSGPLDARITAADGAEFRLVSMEIDTGSGLGTSSLLTITGYRDGAAVVGASDTFDTSISDAAGSVTYAKNGAAEWRGGLLTFNSNWQSVDEIRITGQNTAVMVDELDFEAAIAPNAAPSATNLTDTVVYAEDAGTVSLADIVVSDADVGETITATLTLSNPAAGSLSVGTYGSATSTFNAGTGVWTVSGSVANVNSALAATAFTPAANWDRDVTIATRIRDADGAGPADGVITLDVTPANDAPTATNLTQTKAAAQGGSAAALDDIVVVDVDTGDTVTATLTLSDPLAGTLSTGTFGSATSTFNPGIGVWTVAGSVADVNAALASATLTPSAGNAQNFTITTRVRDLADTGPVDGTITVNVTASDTPPSISGDIAVPADGRYVVGQTMSFTLTFDESVTVSGTDSTLGLTIGGAARSAAFQSKTANSITYTYTVQAGDADADGIEIGGVTLGTSTIRDAGGNDASLSLAGHLPSTVSVLVDTASPAVTSVTVPADGTYVAGQNLDFTVIFDEQVIVFGGDSVLNLTVGSAARTAHFLSENFSMVTYRYTVQAGDIDANGVTIDGLSLGGGAIRDPAGNNAVLTLNSVGSTTNVLVDATVPAITGEITAPANGVYTAGQTLSFTVTFDENVTVTGTGSTLGLTIGGAARNAIYDSKTANSISYVYTVQNGDNDGDGVAVSGISLNGGVIRDAAGNNANLSLAGHLPSTAGVLVDTAAPSFTSATVGGSTLVMTYADAGLLDATHAPAPGDFTVLADGAAVSVTGVVVNGAAHTVTLTLASPVSAGAVVTVAYADPSGADDINAIQDAVGNDAASLAATSVTNTTSPPTTPTPTPLTQTETVDGVVVEKVISAGPGGTQIQTVTIPVVSPSRVEQVGGNQVADIPLIRDSSGATLLGLQAPVGVGLTASGFTAPKAAGDSLADLIREIVARTGGGSQNQTQLTGGGAGFIDSLRSDTPLLVQTIVVTGSSGSAPLGIFCSATGAVQTALVIDTSNLPNGAALELQNVDFAAVVGSATITGGAGAQHVWGDDARQNILLGEGDDVLHGGGGNDTVGSTTGDDQVHGDDGDDVVFGGEGSDFVHGNAGNDTVNGDAGDDRVYGGKGQDQVFGGEGDDLMFGDTGADSLQGNVGQDTLDGGEGDDLLLGGQDADVLFGGVGADALFGDKGDDVLQGNLGDDTLQGGLGDDRLHGGQGDDVLMGGEGDDMLLGDFGDDVLIGGAGTDVFVATGGGLDRVLDFNFAQGDRVGLLNKVTYSVAQVDADTVVTLDGGAQMVLVGVQLSGLSDGWITMV